jgi:hypothetical protein
VLETATSADPQRRELPYGAEEKETLPQLESPWEWIALDVGVGAY